MTILCATLKNPQRTKRRIVRRVSNSLYSFHAHSWGGFFAIRNVRSQLEPLVSGKVQQAWF